MKRRVALAAVVALVAVVVAVAAQRSTQVYDLTADNTLTLSSQTHRVIDGLRRDVRITAFLRADEPGRVESIALLDRYEQRSRRIDVRVVDPDDAPGDVARLGVDPLLGGVALVSGDKTELAPFPTEQDLTAALARLQRARVPDVCFTTGHGEAPLDNARALLARAGYRAVPVDLLSAPTLPASCAATVVAGPTAMSDAALQALAAALDADGKLLILADPAGAAELSFAEVLAPFRLALQRGLVFEGDAQSVISGDVTAPVVRTYSSAHPVVRRLAPTYFPGVQGVALGDDTEVPGLTVSRLADTSDASYLETEPVAARFDAARDRPGPVTVAAAADRSRNDGQRIARSRVVVVGDADFASDRFLGQAGNATLFLRAVEWLTSGEAVAAISPNLAADRPLALTDGRRAYARLVTAGVVPALFALAGAIVWAARRAR